MVKSKSYLMDIRTRSKIYIVHLEGDGDITDSVSPDYADTAILGRSSTIPSFKSTGARTISFSLKFFASVQDGEDFSDRGIDYSARDLNNIPPSFANRGDGARVTPHKKVFDQVNFLRSFLYPRYTAGGYASPPPVAFLSLGSFIKMKCFMKTCEVVWHKPWVGRSVSFPLSADVSLSFESIVDTPYGSMDIRSGAEILRTQ